MKHVSARGAIEDQKQESYAHAAVAASDVKGLHGRVGKKADIHYTNSVTRILFSCSKISVRKCLQKLCAETMLRL